MKAAKTKSLQNWNSSSFRDSSICRRSNIKTTTTASLEIAHKLFRFLGIDTMCNPRKRDPYPSCSSWSRGSEKLLRQKRVGQVEGFYCPAPLPLPPKRTPQTLVKTFLFAFCFKQKQRQQAARELRKSATNAVYSRSYFAHAFFWFLEVSLFFVLFFFFVFLFCTFWVVSSLFCRKMHKFYASIKVFVAKTLHLSCRRRKGFTMMRFKRHSLSPSTTRHHPTPLCSHSPLVTQLEPRISGRVRHLIFETHIREKRLVIGPFCGLAKVFG